MQVGAKIRAREDTVKLEEHLHRALNKHVGQPLHHLGGNGIFGRAENGRSCAGDDVRTALAEGLAGFLQRAGVDTVGIVRRFQRNSSTEELVILCGMTARRHAKWQRCNRTKTLRPVGLSYSAESGGSSEGKRG